MKSWRFFLSFLAVLLFFNFTACKKSYSSLPILRFIPAQNEGVVFIENLQRIPENLDRFLVNFEGKKGQLRDYVKAYGTQFGLDLLDKKSFSKIGLALKGRLLLAYTKNKSRPAALLAVELSSPKAFVANLQKLAKEKLLVRDFKKQKIGRVELISAYGRDYNGQPVEEFAYAVADKIALLTVDLGHRNTKINLFEDKKPNKPKKLHYPTRSRDFLASIFKMPPAKSLQQNQLFAQALLKNKKKIGFFFRIHRKSSKKKTSKKIKKILQRPFHVNMNNPQQLLFLREQLPWNWYSAALDLQPTHLDFCTYTALPSNVSKTLLSLIPTKALNNTLLTTIHKKAIFAERLTLNPQQLGKTFEQMAKKLSLDLKQIYAFFEKYAGINIPKEILPILTGQAQASLYGMHPNIVPRVVRRPYLLPGQLKLGVVVELKDPKKATVIAEKVARTLKFGRRGVTKTKRKNGAILYAIPVPAWPGVLAYWTIEKNYFIYSIGPDALKLTLEALQNPKSRLIASKRAASLFNDQSNFVFINFSNIKELIPSLNLSYTIRFLLANAFRMTGKLDTISFTLKPLTTGLQTRVSFSLTTK